MNVFEDYDEQRRVTERAMVLGAVKLMPGVNVDRIDVYAGLLELGCCGYDEPETLMVIEYALMRWAKGEERAAMRGAIDRSFHGIDLTSWYRVLASARVAGEAAAKGRAT